VPADLVPVQGQLLERLAALGVDLSQVLQQAQLSRSQFKARPRLTTREYFAFWHAVEKVEAQAARRDLGLRLGADALPHQLNVASAAALHSPNLGEALKKLGRYKRLVCPEEVFIERADGEARIRFHWLLAEEPPPMLLVDGTLASALALARTGTGKPIRARRIELTRRPADEEMLSRHFGCEVLFDAAVDLLVLDESALAEPFVTYNEDLLAVMLPGLEAALDERGGARTLADDVRMVLGRRMHGERPTIDKVARELGMSPRTLQRRLEEAGTSYQEILDEVRRQSARRLLAKTDLDAGEVAFLLGFEELNSFTRAFRAWEGKTPTQWRRSDMSRP
jgi:AraC-like DNA-binding protein